MKMSVRDGPEQGLSRECGDESTPPDTGATTETATFERESKKKKKEKTKKKQKLDMVMFEILLT